MRSRFVAALAVAAVIVAALADEGSYATDFKLIHVEDLAARLGDKSALVYDANPDSVRLQSGIVPGAHLLPSSTDYDVAEELPAAKSTPLVFYCANTH